ncbi:hypothetical protein COMNV_00902 [Commensalibacter sp. Nvir]|uniref:baseplate hub protein n=1 Tax=Commensalibacter sp. Nvir TaxID=3069817 RepID=UPI002D5A3926|nr:hypothetical protein COMNV_00902 [Commensalibacter sp. Nvir]
MSNLKQRIIKFQIKGSNGFYLDDLGHTSTTQARAQAKEDACTTKKATSKLAIDLEIEKNAQVATTTATLQLTGLTIEQLNPLTSEFNRFNYDYNQKHPSIQDWAATIDIQVGYDSVIQPIFSGDVVIAELRKGPPDLMLQLTAMSNYFARSQFDFVQLEASLTFEAFANKVGEFLKVEKVICQTDYNNQVITNAGIGQATGDQLLVELNLMFYPFVTAWIDNKTLYVMQLDTYHLDAEQGSPVLINEFLQIPQYTERGASFEVMYDPRITVAKQVRLQSDLNPYPFNGQSFVLYLCKYALSTRNNQFKIQCEAQL